MTGNQTHDLLIYRMMLLPAESHQPGLKRFLFGCQEAGWADLTGKLFTVGCCIFLVLKVLDVRRID